MPVNSLSLLLLRSESSPGPLRPPGPPRDPQKASRLKTAAKMLAERTTGVAERNLTMFLVSAIPAEHARKITDDYRLAIHHVRDTIVGVPCLRDEEWSSLTRHITELYVLEKFGYLKCCSADSVVDGIIPVGGQDHVEFNPTDESFLAERGIQIKGRRRASGGYGFTGEIKLSSRFKFLYIVWLDARYRVEEAEVYRLEYNAVKQLIETKVRAKPKGKNTRKITRAEAVQHGVRITPRQ